MSKININRLDILLGNDDFLNAIEFRGEGGKVTNWTSLREFLDLPEIKHCTNHKYFEKFYQTINDRHGECYLNAQFKCGDKIKQIWVGTLVKPMEFIGGQK